jgi:hypothetical protein
MANVLCFELLLLLILATTFIWEKSWSITAIDLKVRLLFSQADLQHMMTMAIEFI